MVYKLVELFGNSELLKFSYEDYSDTAKALMKKEKKVNKKKKKQSFFYIINYIYYLSESINTLRFNKDGNTNYIKVKIFSC